MTSEGPLWSDVATEHWDAWLGVSLSDSVLVVEFE
jgi:hypothetical protein